MKGAGAVKLALAAPAALLLAACTATSPAPRPSVPPPSVETVTGQALVAQAEAGPGGSVTFPALTFSGPVSTVSRDAVLGSPGGTQAFATPRGTLTVRYTAASAGSAPEAAGSGARACVFTRRAASGTYVITGGTGSFAGATGHGAYTLVFVAETKRAPGGACSPSGTPIPAGDQADFTAGGPLAVPS